MNAPCQSVRGMADQLPLVTSSIQHLENTFAKIVQSYGYAEIQTPILESTALFARGIGVGTDVIDKEMYSFLDRNQESLSLRPEGTAGVARAIIQHQMASQGLPVKLWYRGPMFRYERPQKGRYRQFHQLGAELFNVADAFGDLEMIAMTARLFKNLGVSDAVGLEINTLGSLASRKHYLKDLVSFLKQHQNDLDEDSRKRLDTNPLRILDSKCAETQAMLDQAPHLHDFLEADCLSHFDALRSQLEQLGIPHQINGRLVRGLDYYNRTVFEWVTQDLGAQGTVCAGGRYDSLVGTLGGQDTPAVGFALGIERMILLMNHLQVKSEDHKPHIYLCILGEIAAQSAYKQAEILREHCADVRIMAHLGNDSAKTQLKRADKSGAELALILGDQEMVEGVFSVKYLRESGEQKTIKFSEATHWVNSYFKR